MSAPHSRTEIEDGYYRAGYWDAGTLPTLVDHWADDDPSKPYVSDGTSSLSWSEFRDAAWNLAGALVEQGIATGDRIVVQLPNWVEFYIVYAACARIGAVTVPLVTAYRAGELDFIMADSGARTLITCGEFRGFDHASMGQEVAGESASLRIVVRGRPDDGAVDLADLLRNDRDPTLLPPMPSADDPHLILYSSGTESNPKGCLHSWNTSSFLPKQAVVALGVRRDDVMFMPSPVAHALGLTLGLMAPTLVGGAVHLLDVFDPAVALERIADYRCTGTASPAPFIRMMLDAIDPTVHDVSLLRFWLSAGAPIAEALVEEAAVVLSGCRVVSAYGSSEVMMATVCRPDDPVRRVATSDGSPVPGVEVRTVDLGGDDVPIGIDGEICYRGPGRLLEYWNRPDLTAAATDDEGWWRTGDLGRLDEHGYLRVTGRIKDIIIRGGHNISARQVEEAIVGHAAVMAAAVIGLPDKRLGEKVCAVIEVRGASAPTTEELRHFLVAEQKIASWKAPDRVEVVTQWPTTATGKVQKFKLRQLFA